MDKKAIISRINARLQELVREKSMNTALRDAMQYSIEAGGKRFRPMLTIMGNQLLNGDVMEALDVACGVEMIHTYSLVHDDLPAMDNDEMRRGKPTSHIMFGEAFAILAGDGLLHYAFEVMLGNALRYPENLQAHVRAIHEVAVGSGVSGMVSGQCADVENEGQILTDVELNYIHTHKTGDLIKASLLSGLLLCGPDEAQIQAATTFGYNIGLVFQITDDILDIVGDSKKMGKTIGKDVKSKKFTYPTLYGIDGSRKIAVEKTQEALDCIAVFGEKAQPLQAVAQQLLERDQ